MVLDLMSQLDRESTERAKIETLLRELLEAKRSRKSEQLSADQLALFAELLQARQTPAEPPAKGTTRTMTPPAAPPAIPPRRAKRSRWRFFGRGCRPRRAATRRGYCAVLWPPVSGWESIPTPGSRMC
jgi:hypothetical protein